MATRRTAPLAAAVVLAWLGASAPAAGAWVAAVPAGTIGGPALASAGLVVDPDVPPPPVNDAASYVVADLGFGDVLAAKAPHAPRLPASTLKVLTALTLLPELDKNAVVVGTNEAAAVDGSKAGIDPGLHYSIDLVFKALLLQSGNDAAVTLALAAGGMESTVESMNDVAAHLQAFDTSVANPSGLDAPGQVTSAYDLALITRAALERDDFRAYVTTKTADMPARGGGTFQIQNENRFLADYGGAIGGKNGYTSLARHTFVGAAERDGRTLVVTVLRTESRPEPVVAALMDWGFANAAAAQPVGRLVLPGDPLPTATARDASPQAVDDEPAAEASTVATPRTDLDGASGRAEPRGEVSSLLVIGAATVALAAALVVGGARMRRRRRTAQQPHRS